MHAITNMVEKYHDLPVKLHRWLFCTWAVCYRWADEKTCKMYSRATAFPHKPGRREEGHCNVCYRHSRRILIGRLTHHWEFAISKPHDPAGSFSGPTTTCHPPRHDPAGPPGESSQLPPDELSDPEPTAVLRKHIKKHQRQWNLKNCRLNDSKIWFFIRRGALLNLMHSEEGN